MKTQKERFRAFLKSPYTAAFLRCYVGFGLAASIATVLVMILTSVLFAVVGQKIQISPVAATVIYVAAFSAAPIGAAFLALRKHIRDKDCPLAWVRLFGLLTLLTVICVSIDLLRLGASGKLGRLMITSLLVFPMFPLSGVFSFFGSPEIGLIISCAWPLLLFLLSVRVLFSFSNASLSTSPAYGSDPPQRWRRSCCCSAPGRWICTCITRSPASNTRGTVLIICAATPARISARITPAASRPCSRCRKTCLS